MNKLGCGFHQIGYVTNDFERAMEAFRGKGIGKFYQLREISIPVDPTGQEAALNIGLARSGGVEIEIVNPIGGRVNVWADALPQDEFSLTFHHIGLKCSSSDIYDQIRKEYRAENTALPIEAEGNGLSFFYADVRSSLGHYIEYFSAPQKYWEGLSAVIPEN